MIGQQQAHPDLAIAAPAATLIPVAGSDKVFPVRRIYCVGRNYAEHAREMGANDREPPFFFAKPADAACRLDPVPYPPLTAKLHHEVELAVALGKGGANIAAEQALECVFGYAVAVDLTRRDLQADAKQKARPWTCAKGFDNSAPISEIHPAADCDNPQAAAISLAVNKDIRQQGNTADMIWSVAEAIAHLSRYFGLAVGDLLFTGTPSGVSPVVAGDVIEAGVEGVGSLRVEIVR